MMVDIEGHKDKDLFYMLLFNQKKKYGTIFGCVFGAKNGGISNRFTSLVAKNNNKLKGQILLWVFVWGQWDYRN